MKKKTGIIATIVVAIVAIVVIAIGGYYGYSKYSLSKNIQTSNKIMKDKGVKQNDKDKAIVDDILKNDSSLEYAYVTHNDEAVILNIKFKNGIQDKEKFSKLGKYMDKVKSQYKGKNVNVTTIH